MKRREEHDYKERLKEVEKTRKKVISDFFVDFTKFFRPWLYELTRKYKERGSFPVMACWVLPSYYTDDLDVEIAAIAALLIKDDDKLIERVAEFRQMFGSSPYKWFWTRSFVALSVGDMQNKRTGSVSNKKIAELFSDIYDNWKNRQSAMSIILLKHFGDNQYYNKLHMLWLVLAASDGIGRGVWATTPTKRKSPLTGEVMALLRTFFPDYKRIGTADEVLHLFGFEDESDVFYAALAYKELQGKRPKECSRLATLFQKRYDDGKLLPEYMWTGCQKILPEI